MSKQAPAHWRLKASLSSFVFSRPGTVWRRLGQILCIVALPAITGCQPESVADSNPAKPSDAQATDPLNGKQPDNTQPTLAEQVANVRDGRSAIIRITDAAITPEQLSELTTLNQLQDLLLDAGGIDDDSLQFLNNLSQLEHLRIRQAELTDSGIEQLDPTKIPKLKILNLPQAKLSARGLKHLSQFAELNQLRLGGSEMDDSGAAEIVRFPNLKSLHLIGPKFTDQALTILAEAPKLASFYIDDCRMSDAAWEQLFRAKPNMHVHIDQQHHDRDPNLAHDAAQ